jgi:hypothetical protein
MKKILLAGLFALVGCNTAQQKNVNDFLASPAGKMILATVETTALNAADSALQQYVDTGKVQGEKVAQASLSSVSQQLRGLQATKGAANPVAIHEAVENGSASPVVTKRVAPAIATAIAKATKEGAPADAANEAAARGLDKAAAKKKHRPH